MIVKCRFFLLSISPFIADYQSLSNIMAYQEGVLKQLRKMSNSGEIIFFLNGHADFLITAYSPKLTSLLLVESMKCRESRDSRDDALRCLVSFLRRHNFNLDLITFTMDQWCRVPLQDYGVTVQPVISTAKRHLFIQLIKTFEKVSILESGTNRRLCSPTSYEIVRSRLGLYNSTDYIKWRKSKINGSWKQMELSRTTDWQQISGNISDLFTENDLSDIVNDLKQRFPVEFSWTTTEIKNLFPLLQTSLDCVLLLVSLDFDYAEGIVDYGGRFLAMLNENNVVSGVDLRTCDVVRTIRHLVGRARTLGSDFSITNYNLIYSKENSQNKAVIQR